MPAGRLQRPGPLNGVPSGTGFMSLKGSGHNEPWHGANLVGQQPPDYSRVSGDNQFNRGVGILTVTNCVALNLGDLQVAFFRLPPGFGIASVSGGGVSGASAIPWTQVVAQPSPAGRAVEMWVGEIDTLGTSAVTFTYTPSTPVSGNTEADVAEFHAQKGTAWRIGNAGGIDTTVSQTAVPFPTLTNDVSDYNWLYIGYAAYSNNFVATPDSFNLWEPFNTVIFGSFPQNVTVSPVMQQSAAGTADTAAVFMLSTDQVGVAYVDSSTIIFSMTPSASEVAEFVDTATVAMVLTPSGADVYTPPAVIYTDSATVSLTLTPSATDTAQFVDTGTISLSLTPSATDTAQFIDTTTVGVTLTPSTSDVAVFVDTTTVGLVVTPSSTDLHTITDAATVSLAITPSAADIAQFVDSATTIVALTPSATDLHTITDAGTVSLIVTPSTTDTAQFVDATTASVLITPSSTDTGQLVDSNTARVTLTPSETDVLGAVDSATVSLTLTVSSSDVFVAVDTNTVTLKVTVTPTDIAQFVDTGSAYLAIVASSIDIRERFDANTVSMTLTPSETDVAQFVDTGTASIVLTPSSTDVREEFDSATASLVLSPSSSDVIAAVDAGSVYLTLTPSETDEYTPSGDFATATVLLTPSSSDTAGFVDVGSVVVVVDLSGADVAGLVDSATAVVKLTPSSTDVSQAVDSATVTLIMSGVSFDSQSESVTNVQTLVVTIDEVIHALLVPVSDIAVGTWHDTPLYEKVDEYNPDPSDYIESGNNPVNDTARLALKAASDPGSSSDHFINIQFKKNETAPSTLDLTVRLKEGATVISEQVLSDIPSSLTTLKIPLTEAEIDSISDYTNLSFELVANEVP